MVLTYLGVDYSEAEISQILRTQGWGTPSYAIQRLDSSDIQVVYREWSISELLSALDAERPIIVFVRTGFIDYYQADFAHAVVVVAGNRDQQFWIQDPYQPTGPKTVSWDGLLAAWAEFGYRGAILLRK